MRGATAVVLLGLSINLPPPLPEVMINYIPFSRWATERKLGVQLSPASAATKNGFRHQQRYQFAVCWCLGMVTWW